MEEAQEHPTPKSTWLAKLEEESWQAELIIFGVGFAVALLAFGILSLLSIVAFLFYWLDSFISAEIQFNILIGFYALFMLFAFGVNALHHKRLRDKKWVKRWHYPLSRSFSLVMMNVGYRPASYVVNVISSHATKRKNGKFIILFVSMGIGAIGAALGISNMNVSRYIDQVYHRENNDPTRLTLKYYADNDCSCYIFNPIIPDYEMYPGELFTIFLPLPNRKKFVL